MIKGLALLLSAAIATIAFSMFRESNISLAEGDAPNIRNDESELHRD